MNTFAIYQLEKTQALDVLNRTYNRLAASFPTDDMQEHEAINAALDMLGGLVAPIENKRTQLDAQTITLAELADLLRVYDDQKRGRAAEFFAHHFTNHNVNRDEFLYGARYAIKESDQLLRECVHGVTQDEVCDDCEHIEHPDTAGLPRGLTRKNLLPL